MKLAARTIFAAWVAALIFWPSWALWVYWHPPYCPVGPCGSLNFSTMNLGAIPIVLMTGLARVFFTLFAPKEQS